MGGSIAVFLLALMVVSLMLAVTTITVNEFQKKVDQFVNLIKSRYDKFPKTLTLDEVLNKSSGKRQGV